MSDHRPDDPAPEDGSRSAPAPAAAADPPAPTKTKWLPPRWAIRLFWLAHRALYRLRGKATLAVPGDTYGTMLLRTVGRRSGKPRQALLGYYEDGPNLVTLAMNGWGAAEPAWWLNLQAQPDAEVELKSGRRLVHAREAEGEERDHIWDLMREHEKDLDAYAIRRTAGTAVVVLEPRSTA